MWLVFVTASIVVFLKDLNFCIWEFFDNKYVPKTSFISLSLSLSVSVPSYGSMVFFSFFNWYSFIYLFHICSWAPKCKLFQSIELKMKSNNQNRFYLISKYSQIIILVANMSEKRTFQCAVVVVDYKTKIFVSCCCFFFGLKKKNLIHLAPIILSVFDIFM